VRSFVRAFIPKTKREREREKSVSAGRRVNRKNGKTITRFFFAKERYDTREIGKKSN